MIWGSAQVLSLFKLYRIGPSKMAAENTRHFRFSQQFCAREKYVDTRIFNKVDKVTFSTRSDLILKTNSSPVLFMAAAGWPFLRMETKKTVL